MFRNNGINYKFPRSAGGRFYSQRIDEGTSRLRTEYSFLPPPVIPDVYTDDLWTWNKENFNEFNSGSVIYLGGVTGTVSSTSYYSGSTGKRTIPSIIYSFSPNFETRNSGGLAMIPIDPGFALPKRFELFLNFRYRSSNSTMNVGVFFGANQLSASSTGSFYGSCWSSVGNPAVTKVANITTGTIGNWGLLEPDGVLDGDNIGGRIRFLVENKYTTGTVDGPMWRIHSVPDPSILKTAATSDGGALNITSGSNSSWAAAGNLDRMGLFVGRSLSGSVASNNTDYFEIIDIVIKKHPLGD